MRRVHDSRWRWLERWSPTLFLAAGVLFVGHAAVRGIEAFTAVPPPVDVFGPAGYVAGVLGLVGLYPALVRRRPALARVAGSAAALSVLAWVVVAGWSFGEAAGVAPPQTAVLPGIVFVGVIGATLVTYALFGVASLGSGVHSRSRGVLLLTPAAALVLLFVGSAVLPVEPATGGVIVGVGQALAHWAVGGTLLTGTPAAPVDPTGDVTVD